MPGEHQRVRVAESERRPVLVAVFIGTVLLVVFALSLGSVFVLTRIDSSSESLTAATTTAQPVVAAAQQTPAGSVPSPSTAQTVLVAGGVARSTPTAQAPTLATETATPALAASATVPPPTQTTLPDATMTTVPTSAPSPTVPATPTSPPPSPTMSATAIPATPTSPPVPTPTNPPTPTAVPPATATPTVPPPTSTSSTTELIQKLAAAEEGLRSGRLDAEIDLGNGTRSTAELRFDLFPSNGPARLYIKTRYESGGSITDVEQVVIGDRTWERNQDGTWRVAERQIVMWEVIYGYLPQASTVPSTATVSTGVPTTLSWFDEARNSDITLTIDPGTGIPLAMRRTARAPSSSYAVRYGDWNMPVNIPDPGSPGS